MTLQASLGLEFNNTGSPVHASLNGQSFDFTSGNFARVAGSATINLADFASLSGNFAFAQATDSQNTAVVSVGATGVSALLGVPGSVGISLSNGTLGLLIYPATKTYALAASGDVSVLGVAGIAASGTVRVRANTTGRADLNETILVNGAAVPRAAGEGNIAIFEADALTLVTPVATLTGKFVFIKDGATNEIQAAGSGVSFTIGTPAIGVRVSGASFGLLLEPDRSYAFDASGTATVVGVPDLTFTGSLHAQKNTTGADIDRTIAVAGSSVRLVVAAGLSRFGADNVTLNTPAGNVTGSFAIQQATAGPDGVAGTADDATELLVGASNVNLSVGDVNAGPGVQITGAQLVLLITAAGYAFAASGAVTLVGVPNVAVAGTVGVERNTVKKNGQPVPVAGRSPSADHPGPQPRRRGLPVRRQGVSISLAGQTLTGDFGFTSQNGVVTVSAADVSLVLGDGSNPIVTASNGSGSLAFGNAGVVGSDPFADQPVEAERHGERDRHPAGAEDHDRDRHAGRDQPERRVVQRPQLLTQEYGGQEGVDQRQDVVPQPRLGHAVVHAGVDVQQPVDGQQRRTQQQRQQQLAVAEYAQDVRRAAEEGDHQREQNDRPQDALGEDFDGIDVPELREVERDEAPPQVGDDAQEEPAPHRLR